MTTEGLLGRRYVARSIDSITISILVTVVMLLIGPLRVLVAPNADEKPTSPIVVLVLAWVLYGAGLESSPWGATLGKRLCGLRVYDAAGKRLTFRRAAVRSLVKEGPFLALAFVAPPLSLVWLGVHLFVLHRSPVYQAIHDRVAHSWVAAAESTIQLRLRDQ